MGTLLALHAAFTGTFILLLLDIVNDKTQHFGPVRTVSLFIGALVWELCLFGVIVRWIYHACTATADSKPITEVTPIPKRYHHTPSSYEIADMCHHKPVEQHSSDRLQHV